MIKEELLPINEGETPVEYAARLAILAASQKTSFQKQRLGQFFTPLETAGLMASFFETGEKPENIKILDPCAGTGTLACALINKLIHNENIKTIELVCYEIDKTLIPFLNGSIGYLLKWLAQKKITLVFTIYEADFIVENENIFSKDTINKTAFDIIIANPPFFKLKKTDSHFNYAKDIFIGQPNIYTLFLYASAKLINTGGQLLFLIPSSFCSGSAFAKFRQYILEQITLKNIHVINDGKKLFDEGCVLSNFIIMKGINNSTHCDNYNITITNSGNNEFVYDQEYNKKINTLPLPVSADEIDILRNINKLKGGFGQLGLHISSGELLRTIAFDNECDDKYSGRFSDAIWMQNLATETVDGKENHKLPAHIKINSETKKYLIPAGNYIFLRKYNKNVWESKIRAFPYFKDMNLSEYIAIDKQLLYIHKLRGEFSRGEITELCINLNSLTLNNYLRITYGNINLSIDELVQIPLPIRDSNI